MKRQWIVIRNTHLTEELEMPPNILYLTISLKNFQKESQSVVVAEVLSWLSSMLAEHVRIKIIEYLMQNVDDIEHYCKNVSLYSGYAFTKKSLVTIWICMEFQLMSSSMRSFSFIPVFPLATLPINMCKTISH